MKKARFRFLAVSFILGVLVLCAAVGATATTGPQRQRYVYLIITDHKITFHNDDLSQLSRGSYLRFFVFNEGKMVHSFSIVGKRIAAIKPGHHAQTSWILFLRRGRFKFFDPLNKALYGYVQIL